MRMSLNAFKIKIKTSLPELPVESNVKKAIDFAADFGEALHLASNIPAPSPKPKKPKEEIKVASVKPPKVPKYSVTELCDMDAPPPGMSQGDWESKTSLMRVKRVYFHAMKEIHDLEPMDFTLAESGQMKQFVQRMTSVQEAAELVEYVVEQWWGIKARFQVTMWEYPTAGFFNSKHYTQQILFEMKQKKTVKREETYIDENW